MSSSSTTSKSMSSTGSTTSAPMTSYLDQKQAWGSENGQGFEFKNRDHSRWGAMTEFKHSHTPRTAGTGHQNTNTKRPAQNTRREMERLVGVVGRSKRVENQG